MERPDCSKLALQEAHKDDRVMKAGLVSRRQWPAQCSHGFERATRDSSSIVCHLVSAEVPGRVHAWRVGNYRVGGKHTRVSARRAVSLAP